MQAVHFLELNMMHTQSKPPLHTATTVFLAGLTWSCIYGVATGYSNHIFMFIFIIIKKITSHFYNQLRLWIFMFVIIKQENFLLL